MKKPVVIAMISQLPEKKPVAAKVLKTDLVIIKDGELISVLYGRCLHRGAKLADGYVEGSNLMCGVHFWDYRCDTGVSEYNPAERLKKFEHEIKDGKVFIDEADVVQFEIKHPSPFNPDEYLGDYKDTQPEAPEPYTKYIEQLAKGKMAAWGHHGKTGSMGVERDTLPQWDAIQFLPAQMAKKPLLDEEDVATQVVIGPKAQKPLVLDIPLFVSDMSFGALSREAKLALSKGAQEAGTGICSGEGGMLDDEQAANTKYFYELASGRFGFEWDKLKRVQAFHFKGGQGAKVGTGGHLPGDKVRGEIARVRGLKEGEPAISPATFSSDLSSVDDFKRFADKVRKVSGGIPVGFKLAASHIEQDLDFALEAGADYIILDGRGGGTGAAPLILRDNIAVPTIPALARARTFLNERGANHVSLIITGGLRVPEDFAKALALGADAVAISNSALQAIGCLGMRACSTNNCPVGIATQKDGLRSRLIVDESAKRLSTFFGASTDLMKVLARACGHASLADFEPEDLSTFSHDMHRLSGIRYAGVAG